LPRVFDRFWQAAGTAHLGTGIGLYIVKGIIEAHQGTVWAESEPGQGSTFHFTLPRVRVSA
jgi:signal transduction histidine kinase